MSCPFRNLKSEHIDDGARPTSVGGYTYRLVGFDTPEKGTLARCKSERDLAEVATHRLAQLLRSSQVDLRRVRCSCRLGTEETPECNYGRRCAILMVDGQDVGPLLIREGLARTYVCGDTRCPSRRSWCGFIDLD